ITTRRAQIIENDTSGDVDRRADGIYPPLRASPFIHRRRAMLEIEIDPRIRESSEWACGSIPRTRSNTRSRGASSGVRGG
ncbi:MAG TPA: hypothetical protein VFQ39_19620, partial [Longimicrobium sp.]|nr:hypothetical protein [Longimicrobium sp.]